MAAPAGGAIPAALDVRSRRVTMGCANWPIEGSSGGAVEGLKPSAASDGETIAAVLAADGWAGGCGRTTAAVALATGGGGDGASAASCVATSAAAGLIFWSLAMASGAGAGVEGGVFCGAAS